LLQHAIEIFRCQGFDLAIPAFGFCGVQNKRTLKNDDVITYYVHDPSV
jgi:hypothetical protein